MTMFDPMLKGKRPRRRFPRARCLTEGASAPHRPFILIGHGIGFRTYRTASRANVADRAYGHRRRLFHGRARFLHHLDLAAANGAELSGFAVPDERGDHLLSHQPGDLHSHQRLDRRPVRSALRVLRRDRRLHLGLGVVRAVRNAVSACDEPDRAGLRRRHDDAGRPADPDAHLPQGSAHEGDELLHAARHAWPDDGTVSGRVHHHLFLLALEFLHQCADRLHRDRAGAEVHSRYPHAAAFGLRRAGIPHHRVRSWDWAVRHRKPRPPHARSGDRGPAHRERRIDPAWAMPSMPRAGPTRCWICGCFGDGHFPWRSSPAM